MTDGLTERHLDYEYQWIPGERARQADIARREISGETASTYILVAADAGQDQVKVAGELHRRTRQRGGR